MADEPISSTQQLMADRIDEAEQALRANDLAKLAQIVESVPEHLRKEFGGLLWTLLQVRSSGEATRALLRKYGLVPTT